MISRATPTTPLDAQTGLSRPSTGMRRDRWRLRSIRRWRDLLPSNRMIRRYRSVARDMRRRGRRHRTRALEDFAFGTGIGDGADLAGDRIDETLYRFAEYPCAIAGWIIGQQPITRRRDLPHRERPELRIVGAGKLAGLTAGGIERPDAVSRIVGIPASTL